ncbi:beta alanine-pyruvate transaminase [Oceanicola granulosus HTCC2516]|uniref:Beta alanine-pyruvate transaminase n=1 Tax=Oceanicola granulosus (strain ATCC BAA-861 / DSM 15982 / KCTC 12143 / HTCC2516) TaxID=314256 RepID=Q2CCA1_OCEGH|nr:aspartate aminotransferase family protein [Oceanicola granulosus]EAR50332.1 beta alanine-pyruvate transaminase [Oceanicola granulosus HTCC2516]
MNRPLTPNDMSSFWMPFTPNRDFAADPRLVVAADGMHYTSSDGRQIIDGAAGLWCVNAGHNSPRIVEAVKKQVSTLDYAPHFNFGTPQAYELSARLAALFPAGLEHVFFTNSGSESVDTALKIALHYHRMRGDAARTRLIGRERGYHGVGFGGISVGGMVKNRMHFGTMLAGVDHIRHTHDPERNAFSRGCPEHGAEFADDLIRLAELHDPSTIAAVIVEPMAGSTGVLLPPKGYLQRLREICDRYGILLIFDEVITAYGRLGKASAAEKFGVTPDIITTAKGLTNGTIPMGAVMVSEKIYDSAMENADAPIELFHGYTYSAHPIATAAALATLETYREDQLFERADALAPVWEDLVHGLKGLPHVKDLRNLGLVAAIELESREGAVGARATEAMKAAWAKGLMVRVTGDTIALSPPLIVTEAQIAEIFDILSGILRDLA